MLRLSLLQRLAIVLTWALVLPLLPAVGAPGAGVADAQQSGPVIEPSDRQDPDTLKDTRLEYLAVNDLESDAIDISGSAEPGEIEAARYVGIEADGTRVVQAVPDSFLNRGPTIFDTVNNVGGELSGFLELPCLFGEPGGSCPTPHGPVVEMLLEIDVNGTTYASNRLPVDYVRPTVLRGEVVAPQRLRVVFSEAVQIPGGDLPSDWIITNPSRQVVAVEQPQEGDCAQLDGVEHRPEITETGCSRILVLDSAVAEDAEPTVDYDAADSGLPEREAHHDFAGRRMQGTDANLPPFAALDRVRPALPEITAVNGEAPGGDAAVSARVEAPTVTADNITDGHRAQAIAKRDGTTVAQSLTRTGDGGPITFQLSSLPEPDDYEVTVVVTDPNGNKSTDTDKNGPGDDGSPSTVTYTLLGPLPAPDPPTIAAINGEAPGGDGTVLGNDRTPSVQIGNVQAGDEVTVTVKPGPAGTADDAVTETANGETVTVQLPELPDNTSPGHTITAVRDTSSNCGECPQPSPASEAVTYSLDGTPPQIVAATTADGSAVVVRFSEPVTGDDVPLQWELSQGGPVTAVDGEDGSDRRTLIPSGDVDPGATLGWQGLAPFTEDYHDGHGNVLVEFDDFPIGAGGRLPEIPAIDSIAGQDADGTDSQGRPVFYFNDATPTVTATGLHEDDVALLYRDVNGDGQITAADRVGESSAAGDDGAATIQYSGTDLDPGRHIFYTRARTPGGDLSGLSDPAAYDLDRTPPSAVGDASRDGTEVLVRFSEAVFGTNRAAQWRLDDGTVVTGVEGASGTASRILTLAAVPAPGTAVEYEPGTSATAYRDRNHNRVGGAGPNRAGNTQRWTMTVGPVTVPPDPPDVVSISGAEEQEGAGDSWLGRDATPTVEIETDESGREVELYRDANRDGTGQAGESLGTATSGGGVTGPPTATIDVTSRLPEGTVPLLAVARSDTATSEPDRVSLVLDLTDPRPVAAVTSGSRVTVLFTEPIFGRNIAADWSVSQGGRVESVSVGGSQAERIIETAGEVPAGATISYDPAEGGLATQQVLGPQGEPYHDRVDRPLAAFDLEVSETFPPVVDLQDGVLPGGDEGDSGARDAVFDLTLDRTPEQEVRVGWTTVDGTAEGGSDFRTSSGTVRIPAGQRSGRITVEVFGDTTAEPDEFFRVRLTSVENATLGRDTAGVTILDDDALDPSGGAPLSVHRLGGADRIETAIEISRAAFDSADTVVLARADLYPDALAGAPLAASEDAPILLTGGGALDPRVAAELDRLGAERVILLGGTAALSTPVAHDADARGLVVERIGGADRFDTARRVAARLGTGSDGAYLVQGIDPDPSRGWPDAVSVSPLAANQRRPILLTATDTLPGPTRQALEAIGPANVTIVGGTAVVSPAVAAVVDGIAGRVDRLAGADRYATSSAVADRTVATGVNRSTVWVATGLDWPDSLAAAPAIARLGGVFHLVHGRDLGASPATRSWLEANAGAVDILVVLGGVKAVEPDVVRGARGLLE